MSNQPSTLSQLQSATTDAYNTVASTLTSSTSTTSSSNPPSTESQAPTHTQDINHNTMPTGSLKHQLAQKAEASWRTEQEEEAAAQKKDSLLEKVKAYIPGMGGEGAAVTGDEEGVGRGGSGGEQVVGGGGVQRPEHDVQVEEFLRGQYHSRSGDGMPALNSK